MHLFAKRSTAGFQAPPSEAKPRLHPLNAALSFALAALLGAGTAGFLPGRAYAAASSYDPRDLGLVSQSRDQAPWGMCWAFAGMAALESYAIANGLADESIDLSEEAVPWSVLSAAKESAGTSPAYGWVTRGTRNDSGYGDMMTGYFISGKGPKSESDVPYYRGDDSDPFGSYYEETPPENLLTAQNVIEVTDIAYLGGASSDEIKEAINAYGGVVTGCSLSLDLYNPDTAALWSPKSAESFANHAVCIVGWDDDFPKESFVSQEGELPQQNGAWLVKNSELAGGEVAPYLWISYEDGVILQDNPHDPSYAIAKARPASERSVYALDSDGAVSLASSDTQTRSGESVLTCANVYNFVEGERLSEIMFMTLSEGARYRILYCPVDESLAPVADLSRATILSEGAVNHAGYTTVKVETPFSAPAGYGAIAIELTSENGPATLGTDENVDEYGRPLYTADPQTEIGSFYLKGNMAEPAYTQAANPVTFVLRAYGTENPSTSEPSTPDDPSDGSADSTDKPAGPSENESGPAGNQSNTSNQTEQVGSKLAPAGDKNAVAAVSIAALTCLLAGAGIAAVKLRSLINP